MSIESIGLLLVISILLNCFLVFTLTFIATDIYNEYKKISKGK